MIRSARTILAPKVWPMHWWPRQTPSSGIRGANRSITAFEIPASSGVHGPGEMIRWVGCFASISSRLIWSFRDHEQVEAGVDLAEALDQVVGERVVVVDQDDHAGSTARGRRGAGDGRPGVAALS